MWIPLEVRVWMLRSSLFLHLFLSSVQLLRFNSSSNRISLGDENMSLVSFPTMKPHRGGGALSLQMPPRSPVQVTGFDLTIIPTLSWPPWGDALMLYILVTDFIHSAGQWDSTQIMELMSGKKRSLNTYKKNIDIWGSLQDPKTGGGTLHAERKMKPVLKGNQRQKIMVTQGEIGRRQKKGKRPLSYSFNIPSLVHYYNKMLQALHLVNSCSWLSHWRPDVQAQRVTILTSWFIDAVFCCALTREKWGVLWALFKGQRFCSWGLYPPECASS